MAATDTRGLLFIPDISGFSRFVSRTELDHSRSIIQELLETLIDANVMGLEISEIEGDAILFYRFGAPPPLADLSAQVERMFCDFQRSVRAYDARRYCQCRACAGTTDLTLKVITHYGEFTGYSVREFRKLIGRDVIVAHELLKNDIDHHEYWLVTQSVLPEPPTDRIIPWIEWRAGEKETRLGLVPFRYTGLAPLRDAVPSEPDPAPPLQDRVRVVRASREYATDIITLFHASGDFCYRSQWRDGVRSVEGVEPQLPRVGMRCRYRLDRGEAVVVSTSCRYHSDRIEFTEEILGSGHVTAYLLERVEDRRTRLTIDHYVPALEAASVLFRLKGRRDLERGLLRSLEMLEGVLPQIHLEKPPGAEESFDPSARQEGA